MSCLTLDVTDAIIWEARAWSRLPWCDDETAFDGRARGRRGTERATRARGEEVSELQKTKIGKRDMARVF